MRWIHIDDILELEEGVSATSVRTIPSSADYLEHHYPGFPVMPNSLLIESMAQTAGILVGKSVDFARDVILAKVDHAEFLSIVRPGDRLIIDARLEEMREEGARVKCRIQCGGAEVARGTLVFAVLQARDAEKIGARNFVFPAGFLAQFARLQKKSSKH
jgi:3-hydroxyacyl-[acyl-carrier-protein] dehydratase